VINDKVWALKVLGGRNAPFLFISFFPFALADFLGWTPAVFSRSLHFRISKLIYFHEMTNVRKGVGYGL